MIVTSSKKCTDSHYLLTSPSEAIEEIRKRNVSSVLKEKVEIYLKGDIPEYFKHGPILYLARHIATPNYETLHFLELSQSFDMPTYIGLDVNDKFVPINSLKKAFGKMAIATSISREYEIFTIIDFNTTQGKQLKDIKTLWGQSLVDFHNELLSIVHPEPINVIDDSQWIDRNSRGDLVEHYKKFLSLFIVHGIMFELYEPADNDFVQRVLCPAFEFVEKYFGCRPLVVDLVPDSIMETHNWESYPPEVLMIVKDKMKGYT